MTARPGDEDVPFGAAPDADEAHGRVPALLPSPAGLPAGRAAFPVGPAIPPPAPPPPAPPQPAAAKVVDLAWRAFGSALRVTPSRRRPGVDFLGVATFKGIYASASSMGVLVAAGALVYVMARAVAFVGVWLLLGLAWAAMGAVLWRVRARLDSRRLALLLRKPPAPDGP